MLLLYTTLFDYKLNPSDSGSVPNKSNSNEFKADSEQTNSAHVESIKKSEEIRNVKQAYHLERRFFQ
ncbi:MAG: radical SAM protein [Oscillatoriaceae cyanobacterium Prado104]|nr:radical SAM protein [Oscillatoriaceae cyanobacterium Prado104]